MPRWKAERCCVDKCSRRLRPQLGRTRWAGRRYMHASSANCKPRLLLIFAGAELVISAFVYALMDSLQLPNADNTSRKSSDSSVIISSCVNQICNKLWRQGQQNSPIFARWCYSTVLRSIFVAVRWIFGRAMLCKRGFSRHAVSVRLSVCLSRSYILSKWIKISSKQFFTTE